MSKLFGRRKVFTHISIILSFQVILLSFQVKDSSGSILIAKLFTTILTPAQSAADMTLNWIADKWNKYIWFRHLEDENNKLRAKIERLEQEIILKSNLESKVRSLEDLLHFQQESEHIAEPCIVIGFAPAPQFKRVYINKGASCGIMRYQPVINREGLVGIVTIASPFTSQVQLLTDGNTALAVITEKTGIRGILKGGFGDDLEIAYIDTLEKVEIGEKVITSGLDGICPYGLFVGTVKELKKNNELFLQVIVKPAVNFDHINNLLVIKKPAATKTEEPLESEAPK